MEKFKIGCQTYTWEMLGERWKGSVDDILDAIAEAGYEGVEITNNMIGEYYYNSPEKFAQALKERNLQFPAFGYVGLFGFTDSSHIEDEIEQAEKTLEFIAQFPDCHLVLAGGTTPSRENLEKKFQTMCHIYNEIGKKGSKMGGLVDCHPHSHAGSIVETAEEYDRLMNLTDPSLVGFNPDTGHIVRGGADLLTLLKKHMSRIRHVHLKDVDSQGKWAMMGQGICNFAEVLTLLEKGGYIGWAIAEEESNGAWKDQKRAITENRQYLGSLGY